MLKVSRACLPALTAVLRLPPTGVLARKALCASCLHVPEGCPEAEREEQQQHCCHAVPDIRHMGAAAAALHRLCNSRQRTLFMRLCPADWLIECAMCM